MNGVTEVRPSPIAGTWYSGSANLLSAQVDKYLRDAKLPELAGEVIAVIAPHAGYRYSGKTAGHAFAAILGQKRDLVAIVSPMHAPHPASLLTSAHKAYATPLGSVPVDSDALQALHKALAEDGLALTAVANDQEHSLEIELPFLQRALDGDFALLPIMLRSHAPAVCRKLGHALASVLRGRSALLVASTDLSHFYPAALATQYDTEMLRRMRAFEPELLLEAEKTGAGFACGAGAAAAVLWAAAELGANKVEVLHQSNSGDETGDYGSVVGYGAAAALKQA